MRVSSRSRWWVLLGVAVFLMPYVPGYGQFTVRQDGTGDYGSILEALNDGATSGGEIHVTDGETYLGDITVDSRILRSVPTGATISGAVTMSGNSPVLDGFAVGPIGSDHGVSVSIGAGQADLLNLQISDGAGTLVNGVFTTNSSGTINIEGCTIRGGNQDGIRVPNNGPQGLTINVRDTTINGDGRDGIRVQKNVKLHLIDSVISGRDGSGILSTGAGADPDVGGYQFILDNTVIENCSNEGLRVQRTATVEITNGSRISGNGSAGVIVVNSQAENTSILLEDSIVEENEDHGLDITQPVTIVVERSEVSRNGTSGNVSGFNFVGSSAGSSLTIRDSSISSNFQHGLRMARAITCLLEDSEFMDNGNSGVWRDFIGPDIENSTVTLRRCHVEGNGNNGIVVINEEARTDLVIEDTFSGNNGSRAVTYESKVDFDVIPGRVVLKRNHFSRDQITGFNVVLGDITPDSEITNNLIEFGSPQLWLRTGDLGTFAHNTLVGLPGFVEIIDEEEVVTQTSGVLVTGEVSALLANNIVSGADYGVVIGTAASGEAIELTTNLFNANTATLEAQEGAGGPVPDLPAGNFVDTDPQFISPSDEQGEGNYMLQATSPALNAGTPGFADDDILGNPRPSPPGSNPDMGAYEMDEAVLPGVVDLWSIH